MKDLKDELEWLEDYANDLVGELLPCPFCGEDNMMKIEHTHTAYWWVKCENCNVEMNSDYDPGGKESRQAHKSSIQAAIEMWNRRNGVHCKRL